MTIEERVNTAIADLEQFLVEGLHVEDAIHQAAEYNSLKPEVLRLRGIKALGDLDKVKQAADRKAAAVRRASSIKHALRRYALEFFSGKPRRYPDVIEWVQNDLQITLTADEMLLAYDARNNAFHRAILRDLDGLLPPERLS